MRNPKCGICDRDVLPVWTDTHGIAQCQACGAPYQIYHYEEINGRDTRIDKPWKLMLLPEYVQPARDYWQLNKRRMPSGCSMGYSGDPGRPQELATREDGEAWLAWMSEYGSKKDEVAS